MTRSYASSVITASADEVWHLVRDFDGLAEWHPSISTSRIEGEYRADQIGAVRYLTMPDGGTIRERLLALDDAARSYTYEIVRSPFSVRRYRATIRVAPVTADEASFVEWYADFDADADAESELDGTFSRDVFGAGLRALRERFGQR